MRAPRGLLWRGSSRPARSPAPARARRPTACGSTRRPACRRRRAAHCRRRPARAGPRGGRAKRARSSGG
ncbi:MAG: hypothetical protein EON57_11635 [Alphaproteobacteria bacterium]|nr:MAG: hypothetical protein EON57_11635 [Alphaproteobacteria bacterium]